MKNLFKTLSVIALSLSFGLNAQVNSNKAKTTMAPQNTAKASYVANQEYLAPTSNTGFQSYYGDSLAGFQEAKIKADLLGQGIALWEVNMKLKLLKRNYINTKFNIGPKKVPVFMPISNGKKQSTTSVINGKPIGGGGAVVNATPCVNEDFESTLPGAYTSSNAVTGWTVTERNNDDACNPTNWTGGSSEFSIVATPILNWWGLFATMGVIGNSPLGGSNVAQLNDSLPGTTHMTKISTQFPVTTANTVFQFAYAGYWEDGGHSCCLVQGLNTQPGLRVDMYDCSGNALQCSSINFSPGSGCASSNVTFSTTANASWTNWQVKYIDLTPYIGTCIRIDIATADCSASGHWGSTLVDARCGGQVVGSGMGGPNGGNVSGPVSFCAGQNVAQIAAPLGYSTYQWYDASGIITAANGGTAPTLTISAPVSGAVYTVEMISPAGCMFTSTNAIGFSTVNIAAIGSFSTCAGGASGSATVVGNGSGTGYVYTWINAANNATIGNAATVNNLAPGVYSVVISAFGATGCGQATSTVLVSTAPPGVQFVLKSFCGTEAYLCANGSGSNYQWYTPSLAAISATAGGTAACYTVNPASNGNIYTMTRLSSQGCRDSVQYWLTASPPGTMYMSNLSKICPGGTNGTATVTIIPAANTPPGFNTYSVTGTGTTSAYTSVNGPTTSNTYSFGGLSAGTYTLRGFDGSCTYTAGFSLVPHTYTYNLSQTSVSLCPGNNIQAAAVFPSPPAFGQYTYSWSPSTFLIGANSQNAIISPTLAVGVTTTITYSLIVTPTIVNCPIVKTFTLKAYNPAIPTFSLIPNLCNTSPSIQIVANPPGGAFSSTNNAVSSTGWITPSLSSISSATAMNNVFGYTVTPSYSCSVKTTGNYQVSQFWPSSLSSTVPPLCSTGQPFNLMNIVSNTQNGAWTSTLGTSPSVVTGSNSFNPNNLPTGTYYISYVTQSTPNPTVCPSITTTSVSVTHTSTPLIYAKPEFCTNSAPFTMTVNPTGGGWLVNNGAVSPGGVVNPTLVTVPGMVITYTVMDGPCLNTSTTNLTVSRFYTAAFSAPILDQCGPTSTPINLMSYVQNTVNGSWTQGVSMGQNYIPNGGIIGSTFYPNSLPTGVYTLTYNTVSAPNTLCPDQRTITVSVLNPITPTITQVGPFCNNAGTVQLVVNPANTGQWTSSPYVSSNGVFTPSLSSVGNNGIQYVVGTSTCNVENTKVISIEAFVPATIVSTIPDLCNTSPVLNLTPFTLSNLGSWSGAGISGTSFNPGIVGAGQFVLQHNTNSSPSGICPDVASISVNVYSLATPVVSQVGPFCNSSLPTQLEVTPIGGLFGGPNVGVVSFGGKFNPAAAIIGNNIINYSITSGPCVAYAQTVIKVEKFVSADLSKPAGPYCTTTDPINLDNFVQNPGGQWEAFQSSPGLLGNMFYPKVANPNNNNRYVYATHSMPTATLCPDTAMMRIEVREAREPKITVTKNAECAPVEVVFNDPGVNAGVGIWTFEDGSEPVQGYNTTHVFTVPGTYEVHYNYTDEIGCVSTPVKTQSVTVNEVPKADFSVPEEIYITDPQIQLTNLTSVLGNNTYQWKMTGALTTTTEVNPAIIVPKIGKYQITLTATSIHGCTDEITKTIEVKNVFNVFIPNSFSPNFDGLNDYFIPVFSKEGLDMKSFEMEIFDRWGHSLYHTKDATAKGWDGSVQNKGEPLKEEVYIYRIKYKDSDGNAYNKMGHLSLVK
ncbi:hypothetical protein CNR22_04915 [Sphingobacteriaceae bacterium]|nr:hypothetical protein CNR22_04915 [Sphingobacteriaceae bacterium]